MESKQQEFISDTSSIIDSSDDEEVEEVINKRKKVDHVYSEMKSSLGECDNFDRYDIYTNLVRNMRFEQDMIVSQALYELKWSIEQIQQKSAYKILYQEMSKKSEGKPDFKSLLNYYGKDIFSKKP